MFVKFHRFKKNVYFCKMYNITYKNQDFTKQELPQDEYEECIFTNCNLSGENLSHYIFSDCKFLDCNLSNVSLVSTSLKTVEFVNCKLLGIQFNECKEFLLEMSFSNCSLNFSSFYKLKLKATKFTDCSLEEVDFVETDLARSKFENCDLMNAIFDRTILASADFSTSNNYTINPETNNIKKAKFSWPGIIGLLSKYDIRIS